MNESRKLAEFISELKYSHLPQKVVHKTKNLILDQLGVALAASAMPWSKAVYKDAMNVGGKEEGTIIYYGDKVPLLNAAFVNGSFGHGIELDDGYRAGVSHPACVIIPASLSLGQKERINGKDFILAVVTGYEIMGRISAATAPSCLESGHHPTSASGPFGSAAASAKILGFDTELTLNALGIAGSTACGLTEFNQTGGTVKRIHGGLGASGGLHASLLAREGITGPPTILEGQNGFLSAFSNEKKQQLLTDNLGKTWVVMETGYKRHANCAMNHAPIDSMLKIIANHSFRPEDIEDLIILHNSQAPKIIGAIKEPKTVADAQFSGYFSLAMTVVLGGNSLRNYSDKTLKNRKIRELAKKVRFEVDLEAETNYPQKRMGGVVVKLKNGTTFKEKTEYAKGNPENPFSDEEIHAKFCDLSSMVFPMDQVSSIIEAIDSLDELDDINWLCKMLCR